MAYSALVNIDVEQGKRLLHLLDDGGVKPSLALWLLVEEYSEPRFVISSKGLDELTPFERVKKAQGVLRRTLEVEDMPVLWIMKTTDAFPRALRKMYGRLPAGKEVRISGQSVGERYVEDGYLYRMR